MKLRSVPPYPSQFIANGLLTHFSWNKTPEGVWQIARLRGDSGVENDYDLLFEGPQDECQTYLMEQVEKDYPGLMNQP